MVRSVSLCLDLVGEALQVSQIRKSLNRGALEVDGGLGAKIRDEAFDILGIAGDDAAGGEVLGCGD